jgi:hypothetical protein
VLYRSVLMLCVELTWSIKKVYTGTHELLKYVRRFALFSESSIAALAIRITYFIMTFYVDPHLLCDVGYIPNVLFC